MWIQLTALLDLMGLHWVIALVALGGVSVGTYLRSLFKRKRAASEDDMVIAHHKVEARKPFDLGSDPIITSESHRDIESTRSAPEDNQESVRPPNLGDEIKKSPERDYTAFSRSTLSEQSGDKRKLNFRFEGPGHSHGVLLRNLPLKLVFSDRTSAEVHTIFTAEKIEKVMAKDGSLVLVLTTPPGVELMSEQVVAARFESKRLVKEVDFEFEVKDSSAAVIDLHVDFFASGKLLYGLPISIAVSSPGIEQPDRESEQASPRPLRLDLDAMAEESDKAYLLLNLSVGIDGLSMTLVKNNIGAVDSLLTGRQPELTAPAIQALLDEIRNELGDDYFDPALWTTAEPGHADWRNDAELRGCCERVASAGSILYEAICRSEPCRSIFEYINTQKIGTRLTVATSDVSLPLEIIYPRHFSKSSPMSERQENPVAIEQFWGVRFALETLQSGPGDYQDMRRRHRLAPPAVSFNLNSTITTDASPGPMAIHQTFAKRLESGGVQCTLKDDCESMKENLLASASNAGVIYVYCHGDGASSSRGATELLLLDQDCFVRPKDMVLGKKYVNAPVIILNACLAGVTSPLLFTGFLKAFRTQGALGVIATTFYVPILFGATFGAELVEACLTEGEPLSEKLRQLRQARAANGNLVPLFYSVQCQLDA